MKYSIITCTLNSDQFLEKNINSVKSQKYEDYEHIFIDGFSNDDTTEIIKKYQSEYPNKVFLHQIKPNGISNAMNLGIKMATGDFLIHLHSDDNFYNENVLNNVSIFLGKNEIEWVYGKINVIDENANNVGMFPTRAILQNKSQSFITRYLLKFYNYIPHQAVFIKKSVFETLGYFDESLTSEMDFDLWLRICKKTQWSFLDVIVSNYMIRAGAQSSNKLKKEENLKNKYTVQKAHLNSFEILISKTINIILKIKNKTYK